VQSTWIPSVIQIVAEAFSEKDGTVNSTSKIVRHRIVEVHRDLIEYSYTRGGSMTENPLNLEVLRKLFKLT
jgi:long-chain acyl-CoA synthetase